jgi:hypothetical protein
LVQDSYIGLERMGRSREGSIGKTPKGYEKKTLKGRAVARPFSDKGSFVYGRKSL